MAQTLFWLFVAVFAITAIFAFIALGMIFVNPERLEKHPEFLRFAWALWGCVLAEVAAGVFALWRNLFGLSAEAEIATSKNQVAELIDGLESDGDISEEKAETLRREYSDALGTTAVSTVRQR
jgi:hypothetical protein